MPTSFGVPSGSRKSAAEAGTSSKKSTFPWVWSKKVLSITKPSRAIRIAGCSVSASEIVP